MTNVINIQQNDTQVIDIEVTSNDRGPQGIQGEQGPQGIPGQDGIRGPQGVPGQNGADGRDGAIQYTAGTGINISKNHVISVTSAQSVSWGAITGNMSNQTDLNNALIGINSLIPSQATPTNKLADKDFVNSSIATNTATFRGTYNSVAELPTTGIDNNDYAFVKSVDAQGNTLYSRYKYTESTAVWEFEYTLNNSSFTAAQWATIQSGMTANDKTKLDGVETGAEVNTIETISVDGATLPVTGKNVNIPILDAIYPVGSIYMTATLSTAAQVGAALGGTWVAWGAGRVPVGVDTSQTEFDTVEETGGEKKHTLSIYEIPSHNHGGSTGSSLAWPYSAMYEANGDIDGYALNWNGEYVGENDAYRERTRHSHSISSNGGGQSHNNLQPYITCYMYKRTA